MEKLLPVSITQPIKKKERGKGFPKLSLSSAVEVIEKASKYGRQWTREQFATFSSKAGKGSAKSGAFINRVAALRDFGLVITAGAMIIRTELSDQIVKPIKPEEKISAILQAFLNVDIFKTIVETVTHNEDLAKNDIAEMAVKQLGIARNAKDIFVSSFVESGKFAGVVEEVDNATVRVKLPSMPGISLPTNSQQMLTTAVETVRDKPTDLSSTTFSTKRAGKSWDIGVEVRSSQEVSPEIIGKIIKLIQDAENIAKSFKEREEKNADTDNSG